MTSTERFLLGALIISLLVHLTVYGVWKYGREHEWWRNFKTPAWLMITPKMLLPVVKKNVPLQPSPPPQLTFVDVDPALAQATPPKTPKFYSSENTVAANSDPKRDLLVPEIKGKQQKIMKTTENAKPKAHPLQPSPKTPETPKVVSKSPPKTQAPGDLAMAKPAERPQEKESPSDLATNEPQPVPVHHRPRTIAEAMAEHGMTGEKVKQDGGTRRFQISPSLDTMKTSYGDYDRDFIDAVQERWFQLLDKTVANVPGQVVLEFKLHADGRISDMNMSKNEVTDLLGIICQEAVMDPSPFRPWPMEMRREIGKDYRDITFTFYYLNE